MFKNNTSCSCKNRFISRAFTITETVVVIVIVALSAVVVQISLFPIFAANTFKAQAEELVSLMQMAAGASAQGDKRYEVIINIADQTFTLRQITSTNIDEVLDEEIISQKTLGNKCWIDYVVFDDLVSTDAQHQIAKFRVGPAGWQYGGKIVLLDAGDRPYSIIVSRLSRIVKLEEGDRDIPLPKLESEVFF